MLGANSVLWTYDFLFIREDESQEIKRGRLRNNDEALEAANFFMRAPERVNDVECHVYSVVRRNKMLIAMLEFPAIDLYVDLKESVKVWESVKEKKVNGWTIKWDGNKTALADDNDFVLLDEAKETVLFISFVGDAFEIHRVAYLDCIRIDPLNTTITYQEEIDDEIDE